MMGSDTYENEKDFRENKELGRPNLGIGENCYISNAIIDKNVRIGNNVHLDPAGLEDDYESNAKVAIRDGVLIVTKDAVLPDGFSFKS